VKTQQTDNSTRETLPGHDDVMKDSK